MHCTSSIYSLPVMVRQPVLISVIPATVAALRVSRAPNKLRNGVRRPICPCAGHLCPRSSLAQPVATIAWYVACICWTTAVLTLCFCRAPARLMANNIIGILVIARCYTSTSHIAFDTRQVRTPGFYLGHRLNRHDRLDKRTAYHLATLYRYIVGKHLFPRTASLSNCKSTIRQRIVVNILHRHCDLLCGALDSGAITHDVHHFVRCKRSRGSGSYSTGSAQGYMFFGQEVTDGLSTRTRSGSKTVHIQCYRH